MNEYSKTQLTVRVEDYIYRFIKIQAVHEGLTMAEYLTTLVDDEIARNFDATTKHDKYINQNRRVK
ncbi:hypothetical protein AB4Z45_32020 [Paenibacillus sp. MCAF9]|uniref:hypothetical protein n=1 Tax=Paenibacillus sp. MCAF9 TaxID=3233046 RepID=UPI003F989738